MAATGVGGLRCSGLGLQRALCPHGARQRALQRPSASYGLQRRRWGQAQAAAAVEVQAESAHAGTSSAPEDFRRLFTGKNWDRAWIDGIVRSMTKSERKTNAEECGRVLALLEGLGIPTQSVCNMAALAPNFVVRTSAEVEGVVTYLQENGITGELLKTTLERHPRLLAYDAPASAGGPLASGGARASVALVDAPAGKAVSVSLWREGASFLTSPVSPWRPAES